MIFSTQFGGGAALGSIVQGYGLPEPLYVACDGRPLLRSTYPRLSVQFPVGKLTGTVRTLAATPASYCSAASPNYFVASAASGAASIQYSADGATWSQVGVSTLSVAVSSLIFAGTRWIATGTTAFPIVTTGDNPNTAWAQVTGANPGGVLLCGIAYSASLGRAIILNSAAGTAIYALDNGSTALVTKTAPSSQTRTGVCFTGIKFITLNGATITSSSDAASTVWVDEPLPETASATGCIASNGAGVVVISGVASGLLVSVDHGASFAKVAIPGVPADPLWRVQFSTDRFFIPTTLGVAMSTDGKAWFLEPQLVQNRNVTTAFAKKGSTIVQVSTTTLAYSLVESATTFNAPHLQNFAPVASGNPIGLAPYFIKAI